MPKPKFLSVSKQGNEVNPLSCSFYCQAKSQEFWQWEAASKTSSQFTSASERNLHSKSWEIDGSLNQICHSQLFPSSLISALMFLFEELHTCDASLPWCCCCVSPLRLPTPFSSLLLHTVACTSRQEVQTAASTLWGNPSRISTFQQVQRHGFHDKPGTVSKSTILNNYNHIEITDISVFCFRHPQPPIRSKYWQLCCVNGDCDQARTALQ